MSVSPDEGMQLLAQRYAAADAVSQADAPGAPAADGSGGGLELGAALGVMVRAATSMEGMAAQLRADRRHHWDKVHPVEIPPGSGYNLAGSQTTAGTYKDPDRWGPQDGWAWRIFGWTQTLGPGATQYSIWLDDPNDPTNLLMQSAVSGRWEPAHMFLMPNRTICFTSVGGPLIVGKGVAAEIAIDYLPTYMGLKA